jgi:acyl-CoA-dependent ceramide synthase
LSSIADTN